MADLAGDGLDGEGTCLICMAPMRLGSGLAAASACGTVFHSGCLAAWKTASQRQGRGLACPHCKASASIVELRVDTEAGDARSNRSGLPTIVTSMISALDDSFAEAEREKSAAAKARDQLDQEFAERSELLDAAVKEREDAALRTKLEAEDAIMSARQTSHRASDQEAKAKREREALRHAKEEISERLQRANAMVRAGRAVETQDAGQFTGSRDASQLTRPELESALLSATGAFESVSEQLKRAQAMLRVKSAAEQQAMEAESRRRDAEARLGKATEAERALRKAVSRLRRRGEAMSRAASAMGLDLSAADLAVHASRTALPG